MSVIVEPPTPDPAHSITLLQSSSTTSLHPPLSDPPSPTPSPTPSSPPTRTPKLERLKSQARLDVPRARSSSNASVLSTASSDGGGDGVSNYAPNSEVNGKRLKEWREHFEIEEGEELIYTYGCALVKEIMMHGRIFISTKTIGFKSNILGIKTYRHFPISTISSIRPKYVAGMIPNAIEILHGSPEVKSLFTGIPQRDTTLSTLLSLFSSSSPQAYDSFLAMCRSTRGADAEAEKILALAGGEEEGDVESDGEGEGTVGGTGGEGGREAGVAETEDLEKVAITARLPSTPENVFNLLYKNEAFLRGIWEEQGFRDIKISPWSSSRRTMSYTKPIGGSLGSCTCVSEEEIVHELGEGGEGWGEVVGVTRTPDVPAGKSFSTKSKTVFTHAGARGGTKLHATFQVEWTASSFLKGMINGKAEQGQKDWNALLVKRAREYMKEHVEEFPLPAGASEGEVTEDEEELLQVTTTPTEATSGSPLEPIKAWLTADPIRGAMAVLLLLISLYHLSSLVHSLVFAKPVAVAVLGSVERKRLEKGVEGLECVRRCLA